MKSQPQVKSFGVNVAVRAQGVLPTRTGVRAGMGNLVNKVRGVINNAP
jgi:hypothetical protein